MMSVRLALACAYKVEEEFRARKAKYLLFFLSRGFCREVYLLTCASRRTMFVERRLPNKAVPLYAK